MSIARGPAPGKLALALLVAGAVAATPAAEAATPSVVFTDYNGQSLRAEPRPGAGGAEATASRRDCRADSKRRGSKILARNRFAVVYQRGEETIYGCAFRTKRVHKLERCPCEGPEFKLSGNYAGYIWHGSAIGDEFSKIGAIDLRTGRSRLFHDPGIGGSRAEADTASFIDSWVVTSRGVLAWAQRVRDCTPQPGPVTANPCRLGPAVEIRATDGNPATERVVASGEIDGESLRLSRSHRSISWLAAGVRQSELLRR